MAIDVYSQVPSSNYENGYFQVGMFPSQVKVAGADIMADLAQQLLNLPTSAGSANAQTVTNTRQISSYVAGYQQWFLPGNANTGATTLSVDGLAAIAVHAYGAALLGGELQTGIPALVKYDGTQFNLINPQDATGSFTVTLTGMTSTITGTIRYRIVNGKTVQLWVPAAINGTSNSTLMSLTGIPAAIQPVTPKNLLFYMENNTSNTTWWEGTITASNSSTWNCLYAGATGGFTASGVKGLNAGCVSYTLD